LTKALPGSRWQPAAIFAIAFIRLGSELLEILGFGLRVQLAQELVRRKQETG
jgi:hypothetical protein